MPILKKSIIGVFILIGLAIQAESANAIYSPTISMEVNLIKQHIMAGQAHNGSGTLLSAAEGLMEKDKESRSKGQAVSTPGEAVMATSEVALQTLKEIFVGPMDSLYMIFNMIPSTNSFVSNCLRDDIWMLEDLRDLVAREMIKSYLMVDTINGGILKEDYKYLTKHIFILKKYGNDPKSKLAITALDADNNPVVKYVTSNEYLFDSTGATNSYSLVYPVTDSSKGCPQSDFSAAFDEVRQSWENLKVMSAGGGGGAKWGSIWGMAQARARIKADQWIKANQITLTIGGKEGGNPQSLLKGGGFTKFVAQWNTQIRIVKNMVGPLVPLFTWKIYINEGGDVKPGCMYYYTDEGVYRACTVDQLLDYKTCLAATSSAEDKKKVEDEKIPCVRYKKPGSKTVTETLNDYQRQLTEYNNKVQRSETTFVYSMQLNSVGENNIQAMQAKLDGINSQIKRGYEAMGDKSGTALPTLYKKLSALIAKHCGGEK